MNILSLGGGVQSSTLLLMALEGETEPLDAVMFADTGWEPEAVYRQIDFLEEKCRDACLPLHRVSNGHIRHLTTDPQSRFAALPFHVRNEDGKPAMLKRQCTSEYKIVPIERKVRELLGVAKGQRVPKGVLVRQWIGISLEEASWRIKPNKRKWIKNVWPLVDLRMTRHDCKLWLCRHNYPIPPKSSCIGCPFHDDHYWRWLRDNSPEEFRDAQKFDEQIRSGHVRIGKAALRGKAFLHKHLIPLSEVDLSTATERGQTELFADDWANNECEGVCGV